MTVNFSAWTQVLPVALFAIIITFALTAGLRVESAKPPEKAPDHDPPVIRGVSDIEVTQGDIVLYRRGVSAEDEVDGTLAIQVDASKVNLNAPGEYTVNYFAVDASGNTAAESAQVTVLPLIAAEPDEEPDASEPDGEAQEETSSQADENPAETPSKALAKVTQDEVEAMADGILAKLVTPDMSKRDIALAIFRYVAGNIKYVGSSDKSNWVVGAYVGFTQKRGDCFNYFSCSKVLLTRAGIPNVDLTRVGGTSRHYWQLVDVGKGYYHFDTCPHPARFPVDSFLMTEQEAQNYTARCTSRVNYYVYDYDACPVTVVGSPATPSVDAPADPAEETPPEAESPAPEAESPAEEETDVPAEDVIPADGETEITEPVEEAPETQPEEPETPHEQQPVAEDETQAEDAGQTPPSEDESAAQPEPEAPAEEVGEATEPAP